MKKVLIAGFIFITVLFLGTRGATAVQLDTIEAEGALVPVAFVELAFQTGGTVSDILVDEGDFVQAGDVLVQLDATDLELALAQAKTAVSRAETQVTAAENGVILAETAVVAAEHAVTIAQAQLELVQAGALPAEIAAAEANVAAAQAAIAQATAQQNSVLDGANEAAIAAAQANLSAAEADVQLVTQAYQEILDACFTAPSGEEICPLYGPTEERVRGQREAAEANRTAAQAQLAAVNSGATTGQRAVAAGGVAIAVANRDAAQAQLDLLLAGASPEQIEVATVAVERADLGVALAQAGVDRAETAVSQANAALTNAKTAVSQAEAAVARTTLLAVMDGVVVKTAVHVGELMLPGTPALTLANQDEWLVETTDLSELDVAQVAVGDRVAVTFEAIEGETVSGTVEKIAQLFSLSQGDVAYQATIRLDDVDERFRWGLTAVVQFE